MVATTNQNCCLKNGTRLVSQDLSTLETGQSYPWEWRTLLKTRGGGYYSISDPEDSLTRGASEVNSLSSPECSCREKRILLKNPETQKGGAYCSNLTEKSEGSRGPYLKTRSRGGRVLLYTQPKELACQMELAKPLPVRF